MPTEYASDKQTPSGIRRVSSLLRPQSRGPSLDVARREVVVIIRALRLTLALDAQAAKRGDTSVCQLVVRQDQSLQSPHRRTISEKAGAQVGDVAVPQIQDVEPVENATVADLQAALVAQACGVQVEPAQRREVWRAEKRQDARIPEPG